MGGKRKGRGRHCADAPAPPTTTSSLSLFVNGRAERLRRAETRRLRFYEWGGLRVSLRSRDVRIFMNGVKMGEWESGRERDEGKREAGFLLARAMPGLICMRCRLTRLRFQPFGCDFSHLADGMVGFSVCFNIDPRMYYAIQRIRCQDSDSNIT